MSVISIIKYVILILLVVYLVFISQHNLQEITLTIPLPEAHFNLPLYIVVLLSFLAGIVASSVALIVSRLKAYAQVRSLKKKLTALEDEIAILQVKGQAIDVEEGK